MPVEYTKITEYLKEHGIKPSFQRVKVFEYLVDHKNHPTVDTIYNDLVKEIPMLSKTTIYNILKLFVEKKITQLISIEDNETRYDADTTTHGHFKCLKCGRVYDFRINMDDIKTEGLTNFRVDDEQIYFKGVCSKCMQNK